MDVSDHTDSCEEKVSTAEALGASADLAECTCPLLRAAMDGSDFMGEAAAVAAEEEDQATDICEQGVEEEKEEEAANICEEDGSTSDAIGASADLAGRICPLPGAAMDVADYGDEAVQVDEGRDREAGICEEDPITAVAIGASLPAAVVKDGSNVVVGVKRVSAYLRFSNQNREQVKSKIVGTGGKPTAVALAKALGQLWQSLTDAEKEVFKRPAICGEGEQEDEVGAAPKDAVCDVAGAQPTDSGAEEGDAPAPAANAKEAVAPGHGDDKEVAFLAEKDSAAFPLAKVKRIVKLDPDIRLVSSGGISAIAKATELFVEALASSTFDVMVGSKRRSIRAEDVCSAVRRDPRFRDCIGTSLQCMEKADTDESNEEATEGPRHGEAGKHRSGAGEAKNKRVKKALPPPPGSRSIADCFKRLTN